MSTPQVDLDRERASFDTVAEAYDTYRPGYPPELVQAVVVGAGIHAGSEVLEIGSGTGKATEAFAPLGCSILCLDTGANLIAVARRKLRAYPNVAFACTRFEDWPLAPASFDLVISAQAFHWVDRSVGAVKAADALKSGGHLALFWNLFAGVDNPVGEAIQRVYASVVPQMSRRYGSEGGLDGQIARRLSLIEGVNQDRERLGPPQVLRFPWTQTYTTEQYLGLLNTYSDHLCLDPPVRSRLYDGVGAAVAAQGGTIERHYVAVLCLARRL